MAGEADEEIVEEDDKADEVEEEEKSDKDEKDEVVPVRKSVKSNADFARERIAIKGKKDTKESDDEDELTPKARKLIEEEVRKATAPLEDQLAFRDWFSQHPEDRKYEKQAKARFDAWGTVPVEEVLKTLRASVNVEEKTKAEEKVARGSIKGSQQRAKEETVASTEADFKKVYENVKRGNKGEALKQLGIK